MAVKSTIFKVDLNVADTDRHYYQSHALTVARHPSETDERMMVRVLAFALHASERLAFARDLSDAEEPALWELDDTGAIQLWIDTGLPDGRRLLKAAGKSARVVVYAYGTTQDIWLRGLGSRVRSLPNLSVIGLASETTRTLAKLVERSMHVQCSIDAGQCWITGADQTIEVEIRSLLSA